MKLKAKLALITGGTRGIGKEIAMALAKEGVNIAITYNSNDSLAYEVVEEIKNNNVKAMAIKANVSNGEEVNNMIKVIEDELGSIDVLVNNAGITKDNLLIRMSEV